MAFHQNNPLKKKKKKSHTVFILQQFKICLRVQTLLKKILGDLLSVVKITYKATRSFVFLTRIHPIVKKMADPISDTPTQP